MILKDRTPGQVIPHGGRPASLSEVKHLIFKDKVRCMGVERARRGPVNCM